MSFRDEVYSFAKKILIVPPLLGMTVLCILYAGDTRSSEPFLGVGGELEHHKKKSMLCHGGGMGRNLTYSLKAMVGVESNDVRYYTFYKIRRCAIGGDMMDRDYSPYVISRDESVGVAFEWKTNW